MDNIRTGSFATASAPQRPEEDKSIDEMSDMELLRILAAALNETEIERKHTLMEKERKALESKQAIAVANMSETEKMAEAIRIALAGENKKIKTASDIIDFLPSSSGLDVDI